MERLTGAPVMAPDLRALFERLNVGDGEARIPSEYLLVVGLKP